MAQANAKSKSEKFPPPHQDAAVGHPTEASRKQPVSFGASDASSFSSTVFNSTSSIPTRSMGPSRRRRTNREDSEMALSRKFFRALNPTSIGLSMDMLFKGKPEVSGGRS